MGGDVACHAASKGVSGAATPASNTSAVQMRRKGGGRDERKPEQVIFRGGFSFMQGGLRTSAGSAEAEHAQDSDSELRQMMGGIFLREWRLPTQREPHLSVGESRYLSSLRLVA